MLIKQPAMMMTTGVRHGATVCVEAERVMMRVRRGGTSHIRLGAAGQKRILVMEAIRSMHVKGGYRP
jgi:hypothetical protein